MLRYSIIHDKNPREIILLKGTGCRHLKCTFCDYHLDSSKNTEENFRLNKEVMSKVTGVFHCLEVINSGSFTELDAKTSDALINICAEKKIHTLHCECHWMYRNAVAKLREEFSKAGTQLKIKTGIETFDYDFREKILKKGIDERTPFKIAEYFDECCLLFGLNGQTAESMISDIETGLSCFERVCVNIFVENKTKIKPDQHVINAFKTYVMPKYISNSRVDILLDNTDFGVGGADL